MPDNFVGNFLITVQNATNNQLGQNGQGVCGVVLDFDHEYLGDLSITLTSPAGQSVTLVGPIGFFGPTDFTTWNVTFVPCADMPNPDPGFNPTWNNNQAWGLFGTYTGSYHPFGGCLENFNTGPVNGTWTLTVVDGQGNDVGNFYNYEIIFCDPSGILCFSCNANAGNLLQPDITACEGDQTLVLDLPPTYPNNVDPPPASEYGYTYIIAGAGGVIQAYEPVPDLTGYMPGTYTVCGLSYYSLQETSIPPPNGSLTITQLSAQLNSSSPPFCGDITDNCVNVTIFPGEPDVEEFASICAPECYLFYGDLYCQSGTIVKTLTNPNGCDYTATLYLEVRPPSFRTVNETICAGECAQTPGFEGYCDAGQYLETFVNALGCDSIVTLNLNVLNVTAVISPPPILGCGSNTIQLLGTGSTIGAGTTYLWTASNGGNIAGAPNGLNVLVDAPGDYQLLVCRNVAGAFCCDSASVSVIADADPPDAPVSVMGPLQICADSVGVFTTVQAPGVSSYDWTVPPGVTILGGQGTTTLQVSWTTQDTGSVCVSAVNACGTSAPTCMFVDPESAPATPQITGEIMICSGDTVVYSATGSPNTNGFNWSAGSMGVLLSGQGTDSVLVSWPGAGLDTICVTAFNACGADVPACLPISITTAPPAPTASGPVQVCSGSVSTYITIPPPGTQPLWTITNGSIIAQSSNADTIQVQWNDPLSTGSVCVRSSNTCGESADFCLSITGGTPPGLPEVSGDTLLCAGSIGNYALQPVAGASGYTWTVPPGVNILSGQNTDSLVVDWGAVSGGTICVAALGGCGTGPNACVPVQVNAYPIANAGIDTAICATMITLGAQPSIPGSSGLWTLAVGPGSAIFADVNSPSSSVTVNPAGTYTFRWTEANGICSDSSEVMVAFNTNPTTSQLTRLCDGTNQNYTVSFQITGGTSPYFVNGAILPAGSFLSNLIPSGAPYSFVVSDTNGCTAAIISGSFNCSCTTDAGTMSATLLEACPDGTVTAVTNNDAVLDANDTLSFILHTEPGNSLGVVLDQNSTGIFSLLPGMILGATYYISVATGNNLNGIPDPADPCFSVSAGQPVVFLPFPQPNAGSDAAFCGLSGNLQAVSSNYTGTWSFLSGPGSASISAPGINNSMVQVSQNGAYFFVWTETNTNCSASDTVMLTFNAIPSVATLDKICDPTNTSYTVVVTINGGTPPYQVIGTTGIFNGNQFTTDILPNGAIYNFTLSDANGCSTIAVTGSHNCDCSTAAGTMNLAPVTVCVGDTAQAIWNNDAILDGDDNIMFILHDQPGALTGTIVSISNQPVFPFVPGIVPGNIYYISAIAGNDAGGAVDLNDPCLSVAPGVAVRWKALPEANLTGDATICSGSNTSIVFTGTGDFPLTIFYTVNGTDLDSVVITNAMPFSLNVSPLVPNTYSLVGVHDGGTLPVCSNLALGSAAVEVNLPVTAGQPTNTPSFCADSSAIVQLNNLLSGADPGGIWVEVSTTPSQGGAFNATSGSFNTIAQAAGTYSFQYIVAGATPCPSDTATVSIILHPVPNADAGPNIALNCLLTESQLGGSNSSGGPGISYEWTRDGNPISGANAAIITVDQAGLYNLKVTNAFGCVDQDNVVVTSDQTVPEAQWVSRNISCYGEKDGIIQVTSVIGGAEPVLFSVNGSIFSPSRNYPNLGPGNYTLTLQDANGCEWSSSVISIAEPPELVADLGSDIIVRLGEAAMLELTASIPVNLLDTIIWLPLLDTSNINQPVQTIYPTRIEKVEVIISDTSGCKDSDVVWILLDKSRRVYVPNIFRPENNTLTVYGGTDILEIESFRIYDRWGECLFESFNFQPGDTNAGWTGTYKGDVLPPGVFAYVAVIRFKDGITEVYSGDVTIFR